MFYKRYSIMALLRIFSPNRHDQRSGDHEQQAQKRFFRQAFFKYEIRKGNGYDNAEFVDGNDHAYHTVLDRIVIAEPGSAGGNAGEGDEQKLFFIQRSQLLVFALGENDHPCHEQYHTGADGSS